MNGEFGVLVAAADAESRRAFTQVLSGLGLKPEFSASVRETQAILSARPVSLVFCEEKLADGGYQDVLRAVKKTAARAPVVVASQSLNWYEYLEALRLGAFEYLDSPLRAIDVEMIVRYAVRLAEAAERREPRHAAATARVA
jgi:two-component system response regulator PilR (NtrC family)